MQLTLKMSNNIDISSIDFRAMLPPSMKNCTKVRDDITTCHSGVIQEDFLISGGSEKATKVYLDVLARNFRAVTNEKYISAKLMHIGRIVIP